MLLKSITLHGFKSFAERVTLPLAQGITVVVGPNGSGKSNVADAVLWAAGLASARDLRGAQGEDVIFSGSRVRRASGMAEIILVFDNSDGTLDVPAAEVSVTRRQLRSGAAEVFINGQLCRQRDVEQLLSHTGIASEGYSVLTQGQVEQWITARPQELRQRVEEVAGVRFYREQRHQATQELAAADHAWQRVRESITLLDEELPALHREVLRAEQAAAWQEELRDLEHLHASADVQRRRVLFERQSHLAGLHVRRLDSARAASDRLSSALTEVRASALSAAERLQGARRLRDDARTRLSVLEQGLSHLKQEQRVLQQDIADRRSTCAELLREQESVHAMKPVASDGDVAFLEEGDPSEWATRIEERARLGSRLEELVRQGRAVEESVSACEERLESARNELETLAQEHGERERMQEDAARVRSAAEEALERAERSVRDQRPLPEGVRAVLAACREGRFKGLVGRVGDLFSAQDGAELAIWALLGGAVDNLVFGSEAAVQPILRWLRSSGLGRVTFLPLDLVHDGDVVAVPKLPGIVGRASDLVTYTPEDAGKVARMLLGRSLIVDTSDTATIVARKLGMRVRIAALTGELVLPGGALVGGRVRPPARAHVDIDAVRQSARRAESDWRQAGELQARARAVWERMGERINILEGQRDALGSESGRLAASVADAEQRMVDLHVPEGLADTRQLMEAWRRRQDAERLQQRLQEVERTLAQSDAALSELEQRRSRCDRQATAAELACHTARDTYDAAVLHHNGLDTLAQIFVRLREQLVATYARQQANVEKQQENCERETGEALRLEQEITDTTRRVEQAFGRPVRQDVPNADVQVMSMRIEQLRGDIAGLGAVNQMAPLMLQERQERLTHLRLEEQERLDAKDACLRAIARADDEIGRRVHASIIALNAAMEGILKELVDGAQARLVPVSGGFELACELPGKRARAVSLLSGGERALLAMAFVFAFLQLRPSPLYVFDEVDAPLDDLNVERFARYLRRLAGHQVILISHQRGTMEVADTLIGVTMENPGVSHAVVLPMHQGEALVAGS